MARRWLRVLGVSWFLFAVGCDDDDAGATAPDAAHPPPTPDASAAGCVPRDEVCNGVDDDCDLQIDEGTRNACGQCGAPPVERCNGADDDCDGAIDEGVTNACGGCGAPPDERCDGSDDDCDGEIDEGVLNRCGACGPAPPEVCNARDDDCDGETDEGVTNACGSCGLVEESCNSVDDDCDGITDEGVDNACGGCGDLPPETCNSVDDDCDGATDEGARNACGGCGALPEEVCDNVDDDCDGLVDEADGVAGALRNACGACGPVREEACNGQDDDCDGETDEGVRNACGQCGVVPAEVCNGIDDNCDGTEDEGVVNICGVCGPDPVEVCNERDDDCDMFVDEGLRNACGGCGEVPAEVCNGRDDDCDGRLDEGLELNRCGTGCQAAPLELCNGVDEDCDGTVDEDLPTNRCGLCGPIPAEVCNEVDDDCDGGVDEGYRLNRCGGCGPDPQEVCNGLDEDCDGRVDEDFRVGRSVEHCGGCDSPCSDDHATPACVDGGCVVVACEEGFRDVDRDPSNGCEAPLPAGRIWYVERRNGRNGTGALEDGFFSIAMAHGAANPGDTIVVLPSDLEGGVNIESVNISKPGIVLRARDRHRTRLKGGNDDRTVVTVTGEGSVVADFEITVEGAPEAIKLACVGCAATGNRIVGRAREGRDAVGIRVDQAEAVRVQGNLVEGLEGGNSGRAAIIGRGDARAAAAFGLFATRSRDLVVADNVFRRLVGRRVDGLAGGDGFTGGRAAGMYLDECVRARLRSNTIELLTGGIGSEVEAPNGRSGGGGDAVGVEVRRSTDVVIDGSGAAPDARPHALRDLTGGTPGHPRGGTQGRPGSGVGLALVDVEGVQVLDVLVEGPTGGGGAAASRDGGAVFGGRGGSGIGARVTRSTGVRFDGVRMVDIRGGIGPVGAPRGPTWGVWTDGTARQLDIRETNTVEGEPLLLVADIDDLVVADLVMARPVRATNLGRLVVLGGANPQVLRNRVVGAVGASGETDVTPGGATIGEDMYGVVVSGATGVVVVADNVVSAVRGGPGGERFGAGPVAGGAAAGISVVDCERLELDRNEVRDIAAGAPFSTGVADFDAGVEILDVPAVSVRNLLVARVESGGAAGLLVRGGDLVEVARSTFYDIVGTRVGMGVLFQSRVERGRVGESLFARISGGADSRSVASVVDDPNLLVDYCARDRAPTFSQAEVGDHNLEDVDCFTDEIRGALSIRGGSECVDAGDPARDCGDEPANEDGVCVLDIGHQAGTGHAHAAPP